MNIKGVFQVWMRDGSYHEVPLKEAHAWTREGCKSCPDFAAEHADISTGGIGAFNDWTLTIIRTERGRELFDAMVDDGAVEVRPIDEDPGAVALLRRLSRVSRRAVAGDRGAHARPPPRADCTLSARAPTAPVSSSPVRPQAPQRRPAATRARTRRRTSARSACR